MANPDGTISPGEGRKKNQLLKEFEIKFNRLYNSYKKKLHKLGGPFRSPGYRVQLKQSVKKFMGNG